MNFVIWCWWGAQLKVFILVKSWARRLLPWGAFLSFLEGETRKADDSCFCWVRAHPRAVGPLHTAIATSHRNHWPLQPRETAMTTHNCAQVYLVLAGQHPEGQRSRFQWPRVAPRASPFSHSLFWRQGLFWGTPGNILVPAHGQVCFPHCHLVTKP